MKTPAAETTGRPLFECLFFGVIPAIPSRMLSGSGVGNLVASLREESLRPSGKIPDKPTVGRPEVGALSNGAAGMTEIRYSMRINHCRYYVAVTKKRLNCAAVVVGLQLMSGQSLCSCPVLSRSGIFPLNSNAPGFATPSA